MCVWSETQGAARQPAAQGPGPLGSEGSCLSPQRAPHPPLAESHVSLPWALALAALVVAGVPVAYLLATGVPRATMIPIALGYALVCGIFGACWLVWTSHRAAGEW